MVREAMTIVDLVLLDVIALAVAAVQSSRRKRG
jgi:hypothetical protein